MKPLSFAFAQQLPFQGRRGRFAPFYDAQSFFKSGSISCSKTERGERMSVKFTQLQCKEVICVKDGRRLGFVEDVLVEVPEGTVRAIVVPGPCRYFGVVGRGDDFVIPWKCICRIGPDIILVDTKPEECRVKRNRGEKNRL